MVLKFKQTGKSFVVPPGINLKPRLTIEGVTKAGHDLGDGATEWSPIGALEPGQEMALDFAAEYSIAEGRYVVVKLALESTTEGPEVTGALLRSVRVQEMLRYAANAAASPVDWSLRADFLVDHKPELFEDAWSGGRKGPSDLVLRSVALTYRLAEIQNERPALIVSQLFMLSPRTATNWIKRAREGGYFGGE